MADLLPGPQTIPIAKLDEVSGDAAIFRASYQGVCVTLSPAMTVEEFGAEIAKLERLKLGIADERDRREAARS